MKVIAKVNKTNELLELEVSETMLGKELKQMVADKLDVAVEQVRMVA